MSKVTAGNAQVVRLRFVFCALCWLLAGTASAALMPSAAGAPGKTADKPGQPSIAFYYGGDVPAHMLSQLDRVVVDAGSVDAARLETLRRYGARVYAYVSVGEIDGARDDSPTLPKSAILGENRPWHSQVIDLASPEWRRYLLDRRIAALWKQGYRAFFLDTLDSFRLYVKDKAGIEAQAQALASLIEAIHERYPGVHLLLNRGFEVLPQVHADIDGVVAESLFKGWDQATGKYTDVSAQDREWLIDQLKTAEHKYHVPAIVIDYLPPNERKAARADAKRIQALGFTPWVTNAALDQMGVGSVEVMPRRVLMLYMLDDPSDPTDDIVYQQINMLAAMPLEYMGYVPVYHDMRKPLPAGTLRGRYAGIVTWFNREVADPAAYRKWLIGQMTDGVPVAMLGTPGVTLDGALLARMGLRPVPDVRQAPLRVASRDAMMGFEGTRESVPPGEDGYLPERADVHTHLVLQDAQGNRLSPVVTGPWGGIALSPWIVQSAPMSALEAGGNDSFVGNQQRWLLDPFRFFRTALHLKPMPIVDATTENGNRIASAHIDGDGFASRANLPGTPFAGQVICDRILKHFRFPTTVSVITGTVRSDGLYPKLAPRLQQIAREIFRLPSVEIASHTYSHPFDWQSVHDGMPAGFDHHNLPIPGYRFSFKREIEGSVHYIDTHLAPPGKKVKVLLWSGDALPPPRAMQWVHKLGIAQMNGGNTDITKRYDTLANVSPMTRPVGPYQQVYAPDINEEVYTNGYKGPYWGFDHVIQTFELTNAPRRLKPMSIYYHFFSGTRQSSLNAVAKTYAYVLSRPILPMFESDYARIVENYRHIGVARAADGAWIVTGATDDRTLRLPPDEWPDLEASTGVVGVNTIPQGRYVALSGAPRVKLVLRSTPPVVPYLQRSNGRVVSWRRTAQGFALRLRAEMPLKATLARVGGGCRVTAPGARQRRAGDGRVELKYSNREAGDVRVVCP